MSYGEALVESRINSTVNRHIVSLMVKKQSVDHSRHMRTLVPSGLWPGNEVGTSVRMNRVGINRRSFLTANRKIGPIFQIKMGSMITSQFFPGRFPH